MEKIAICIPTYNRSSVIEELLIRCGKYIAESGYDLYIFDSSENDDTEEICKKYKDKYVFNYRRINSSIHSNMKVYMIYQDTELIDQYDYIWIWSDNRKYSRKVLEDIREYEEYDFVVIDHMDKENIGNKEYYDFREVFHDIGWKTTLYGATIVNTKTVLSDIDWEKYEKKYMLPECINFSHVCFYFERMTEMKSVRVRHSAIDGCEYAPSPYKKQSGWHDEMYTVWWEYWYNAIMMLPDVYTDKYLVIRKHSEHFGLFTFQAMLHLRVNNSYSLSTFFKYIKRIPIVTDVSMLSMFLIAVTPHALIEYGLKKTQRKFIRNLKKFVKKYPDVYIYGGGYNAGIVADFMQSQGIEYMGFCVSQLSDNNSVFKGKEVVEYNDSLLQDGKTGIILGLNEKNAIQVLDNYFTEKEKRERVFEEFRIIGQNYITNILL